ncbi:MAG: hypothetical protein KU37_05020 [Sulfuricurvum sp. PC08-66]|nr:MAG: hypothetical protein KU37_05020 [Sulfuricurvum sp. PC08-66]
MRQKRRGFTVAELSIVMIVMGLLLGMMFKAQEIIRTAKLKRVVSDFQSISTAIYTYEDRYGELPGDDSRSVIAKGMQLRGNSDGHIDAIESKSVMRHLRKAGLVAGEASDNTMRHALDGPVWVIQANLADQLPNTSAVMPSMARTAVCFENVHGDDAAILDSANDDGDYAKGSIQANSDYTQAVFVTLCSEL